jgi:hypothetical protein
MMYLRLCRSKTDCSGDNEFRQLTSKKIVQVSLQIMKATMQERGDAERDSDDGRMNAVPSPQIFLGDAWFSSVELAYHAKNTLDVEYIGIIKSNSGRSPKGFLEQVMKEWPGGSHLVLKTKIDDIVLYAIGYKYCSSKTLTFITTEKAGHTEPGMPYVAKWIDENCNQCHCHVPRPSVIATYFKYSNIVDVTNQQRQKELRLEKCWITHDGIFRIITTLIGMTVVDSWWAYQHHTRENHRHNNIKLLDFCDYMAYDMLCNDLPAQPNLHDSHSIIAAVPRPLTASNNNTMVAPPHQVFGAVTPPKSIMTMPNSQSPDNTSMSDLTSNVRGATAFEIAANVSKHDVKQTNLKVRNPTRGKGWRPKRAICIEKDCNNKTSKYCEICDPGRRDHYWLCSFHAEQHKEKIIEDLKKQYNLP